MVQYGAVCGRFQIFHMDHLQYCLAAAHRCEHLIVGITSPDKSVNPLEAVDPHRCTDEANPCNYYERMKMIEGALLEAGLPREKFDIVPFPIGRPELIQAYVPAGVTVFVTVLCTTFVTTVVTLFTRVDESAMRFFFLSPDSCTSAALISVGAGLTVHPMATPARRAAPAIRNVFLPIVITPRKGEWRSNARLCREALSLRFCLDRAALRA